MNEASQQRSERQNAYGTSKEQILAAAEELFARNGFSRTTLKDVARESGANTALVGYHFGSKDGLRTAVIQRQLEIVRKEFSPVLNSPGEISEERLGAIVDALLSAAGSSKTLYCLHLWGLVDGREQAEHVMNEVYRPVIKCLANIISDYNKSLDIEVAAEKDLHADCKAYIVFGLMDQYAIAKWHLFELANVGDQKDFLECHRQFSHNTILRVIKQREISTMSRNEAFVD